MLAIESVLHVLYVNDWIPNVLSEHRQGVPERVAFPRSETNEVCVEGSRSSSIGLTTKGREVKTAVRNMYTHVNTFLGLVCSIGVNIIPNS